VPGGAPKGNTNASKGKVFEGAVRAYMAKEREAAREVVAAMFDKAREGDVQAANWIRDTADGKPKQQVEHSGDTDSPFVVVLKAATDLQSKLRG